MKQSARWAWRLTMVFRELRAQLPRHAFHALCLAVGLAAYAGTVGFSGRITHAIDAQTRSLLGADFEVSSTTRLAPEVVTELRDNTQASELAIVEQTVSMARPSHEPGRRSRLVELHAMAPGYGQWLVDRGRIDPRAREALIALGPGQIVVEEALLDAWKLRVAEGPDIEALTPDIRVDIGGRAFVIRGRFDPARASASSGNPMRLGPRIYMGISDADELGLTGRGTRFQSRVLLDRPEQASMAETRARIEAVLDSHEVGGARVRSFREAASSLSTPLRNLAAFLEQIALGILGLAILGAATSSIAYLRSRAATAYTLRCLGCTPRDLSSYFLGIVLAVAVAGTITGLALGGLIESVLAQLLSALVRTPLAESSPRGPLWLGGITAAAVVVLATLPTIFTLAERRGREPRPGRRARLRRWNSLCWGLGLALMVAIIVVRAPSLKFAGYVAAGYACALLLVWGAGMAFLATLQARLDHLPTAWKIGAAQLLAHKGLTSLLMATIGCAVFLVVTVAFARDGLIAPLRTELPEDRPTNFLVGIASDEVERVEAALIQQTGHKPEKAPIVQARLTRIDGRAAEDPGARDQEDDDAQRGLSDANRERSRSRFQRLTFRPALQPGERLVAGSLWSPEGDTQQVSLERRFARRIGAELGTQLGFDVQGIPIELRVTSIRDVDWASGRPNFFIVAHPEALAGAPAQYVMAVHAGDTDARAALQARIVEDFPNITVIDVHEIIERMSDMMNDIVDVTTLMATLVLAASLTVLVASILAARHRKIREFGVLRTLGAGRGLLTRAWFAEFVLLGAVASSVAAVAATLSARVLVSELLQLPTQTPILLPMAVVAATTLVCVCVGTLGSSSVLRKTVGQQLREG